MSWCLSAPLALARRLTSEGRRGATCSRRATLYNPSRGSICFTSVVLEWTVLKEDPCAGSSF